MERRQALFVGQDVAPPLGPGGAHAQAHGAVGPDHPRHGLQFHIVHVQRQGLTRQFQGGAGVGRPPAQAGGDGQALVQRHPQRRLAGSGRLAQGAKGAQDQIVGLGRQARAERAGHGQRQAIRRLDRHPVADVGEGDEAGQGMIAVGVHGTDVQEQIDLGRGQGRKRGHGAYCDTPTAGAASSRPLAILRSTSTLRSGSGSRLSTRFHSQTASRRRPTFQ